MKTKIKQADYSYIRFPGGQAAVKLWKMASPKEAEMPKDLLKCIVTLEAYDLQDAFWARSKQSAELQLELIEASEKPDDPAHFQDRLSAGRMYMNAEEYEKAIEVFDKLISLALAVPLDDHLPLMQPILVFRTHAVMMLGLQNTKVPSAAKAAKMVRSIQKTIKKLKK